MLVTQNESWPTLRKEWAMGCASGQVLDGAVGGHGRRSGRLHVDRRGAVGGAADEEPPDQERRHEQHNDDQEQVVLLGPLVVIDRHVCLPQEDSGVPSFRAQETTYPCKQQDPQCGSCCLLQFRAYAARYGRSAMKRARLIARAISRWRLACTFVRFLARIFA